MGKFVTQSIEHEDLGDGDWVDIRKGLSQGEMLDIAEGSVGPDQEIHVGAALILQMRAGIAAWGGPGFTEDGVVVPITVESLRRLSPAEGQRLIALVNKHNPSAGADEKKGAGSGTTDSSSPAGAD